MHKLLNLMLVTAVLACGFILYSLEHETRGLEREASRYQRGINDEIENMRLLSAEWSSLVRPDRIRTLAERFLGLSTLKAQQIVKLDDLSNHVPAEPVMNLQAEGSDPIGDIIDEMKQQ